MKAAERPPSGLPPWEREDRLTGLHSRAYFEELLRRDWQLAQRESCIRHIIDPAAVVLVGVADLSKCLHRQIEFCQSFVISPPPL